MRLRAILLLAPAATALVATGATGCEAIVGFRARELGVEEAGTADADGAVLDVASGADGAGSSGAGSSGARDAAQPPGPPDGAATADAAALADATALADAAARVDAAADAQGQDATMAADADAGSPDAADADADGKPPLDPDLPCAQQASYLYCNDFDETSSIGQTWTWYTTNEADAGAAVEFDSTDYHSSPRSAKALIPPTGSTDGVLQLGEDLGVLSNRVRFAFDFRVDVASMSSLPQTALAQVVVNGGTIEAQLVLGAGAALSLQVPGGKPATYVVLPLPPVKTWTRVGIEVDATGTVSVAKDGALVGSVTVPAGNLGDVTCILGAPYWKSGGSGEEIIEFDDVLMTGN